MALVWSKSMIEAFSGDAASANDGVLWRITASTSSRIVPPAMSQYVSRAQRSRSIIAYQSQLPMSMARDKGCPY